MKTINLKFITIVLLTVGLAIFISSLTIPRYVDVNAANELHENGYEMDRTLYYEKEEALSTNKLFLMDLGSGIIIVSLLLHICLTNYKLKKLSDFKQLPIIPNKSIFLWANLAWLLLVPGTIWYYLFRESRGDYPPFADSIGIPLFMQITALLFILIPLNLFLSLVIGKSKSADKLFPKPNIKKWSRIGWEVFFGFFMLLNMLFLSAFTMDGDHVSIPVNLFFTFILLNLRARKIHQPKHQLLNVSSM